MDATLKHNGGWNYSMKAVETFVWTLNILNFNKIVSQINK